jgi:hypothetical protein
MKTLILSRHLLRIYQVDKSIRFFFLAFICLIQFVQAAGQYTNFYYPVSPYTDFDKPESYVVQKFTPTINNPFDGTVMIQRVYDPNNTDDAIQITLVDQNGQFVRGFFIFEGLAGTFTPTCVAYNGSLTSPTYCVAGINEGNATLPNTSNASWFLFLDGDLNVINAYMCGVDLTGSTPYCGPEKNLYVSDITSVEGTSNFGNGDFAFIGVAGNASDPSPTSNSTTTEHEMYVGYASSTGMGLTRAFDFGNQYNDAYFPSRIIEIPLNSTDGGFIITGTGPVDVPTGGWGSLFFTRTDYNLQNSGTTDMYTHVITTYPDAISLFPGDLFFDKNYNEVWFAGSTIGINDGGTSLIFNKIWNLNVAGVDLFDNTAVTSGGMAPSFGKMGLFTTGIPKIAKIMPTGAANVAAIASNFYETSYYANNTTTFPMLNKIDFGNSPMDDFVAQQATDLFTYTRMYGNIGVGNELPYLQYNKKWYPSHNAHEMPIGNFPNESYVLGQSTLDPIYSPGGPEYIVLNRTDFFYTNPCDFVHEDLNPSYLDASVFSLSAGWGNDQLNSYQPSTAITDISTLDINECASNPFKLSDNLNKKLNLSVEGRISNNEMTIETKNENCSFKLYNMLGELILKGSIDNNLCKKDVSNISDGIYFLEVFSSNLDRIRTIKFQK